MKGMVLAIATLISVAATVPGDNRQFEITKNLEIFANLYKELNHYYVDDIDPGKLMRTGIDAMVESLDPYTNYISESQIEEYRYVTEGKYKGIGASSMKIGDFVTITEIYEGQPAQKAGLKVGDQILAVDGNDARGRDPEQLNEILRGFPGTSVTLTIQRPGKEKPIDLSVTREEVNIPNVPNAQIIEGDIAYITLKTFTRNAGRNVGKALEDLKNQNPDIKGVIFDLRGNGGGLLSEAVNVSNVFIPGGELIVTTKGKVKDWDRSFDTRGPAVDEKIPLAVVIDERSASASEIVCGVMQDYDRGVLVGQRTFGKGLVQNTKDIGYNSKLKLTTAKYYIPSGRCIQSVEYNEGKPVDIADELRTPFKTRSGRTVLDGGGVKPDIVIKHPSDIPVIKDLVDQHIIFDFVTQYCMDKETVAPIEELAFEDFNQFTAYLEERDFRFDTKSERLLNKLQDAAAKEGFELDQDIRAMEAAIEAEKREAVNTYRQEITNLIEKEIASRYYFQDGEIQIGLRNDKEIQAAIKVLRNREQYQNILGNKK